MDDRFDCFKQQKQAVKKLLCLHELDYENEADLALKEPKWKILIYDSVCQNIVSLLYSVKELRELGVTLYQPIKSNRMPIPDTPAIYFMVDSEENIKVLEHDMRLNMYNQYYISFLNSTSRLTLERLADIALETDSSIKIEKIFDEYLNFYSLDTNFFISTKSDNIGYNFHDEFLFLNNPSTDQRMLEEYCDSVVDTIYSFLVTLDCLPIIRCQRNNASELIAYKLEKRIRNGVKNSRGMLFSMKIDNPLSLQRPLLVLVDRSIDISNPLRHSLSYLPLIHDSYGVNLNSFSLILQNSSKSCNLSNSDFFWASQKFHLLPDIADQVAKQIDELKSVEKRINAHQSTTDNYDQNFFNENEFYHNYFDKDFKNLSITDNASNYLSKTVESLPELMNKKKFIDLHTNIATELMKLLDSDLPDLSELEQKIVQDMATDKNVYKLVNKMYDLFMNSEQLMNSKLEHDLLRLLFIKWMSDNESYENYFRSYEKMSEKSQLCNGLFNFIKKWKKLQSITNLASAASGPVPNAPSLYGQISKYIPKGSKLVMQGVKNLVNRTKLLPLTQTVESLMEPRNNSTEANNFVYIDPKSYNPSLSTDNLLTIPSFNKAIVFVVGGGSYIEYMDLLEFSKNSSASDTKQIIYGCCEILRPDEFLIQLSKLGQIL